MTEPSGPAMMRMITGAWVAQAVFVAARLGVADLIAAEGPRPVEGLAARVDADPDALYRVLRALAGVGVFAEGDGRVFALTPLAECLRSDVPHSLRAFAVMMGEQWVWRSWGEALHSVRTGEPAFDHVYGMPLFDYYAGHPEAGRVGAAGLSARSSRENAAVLAAYDFDAMDTVTDVGGGEGSLLRTVLGAHPHLRGVLFEMPHVVELARTASVDAPEVKRCEFVAGDFLTEPPPASSLLLLKKVIHDWPDERAVTILRNCRAALPDGGRLLLVENVIAPGNEPSFGKWLDLLMLVYAGGRERTVEEFRSLLSMSGFRMEQVIPTAAGVCVIEAFAV
jgi:O-methyltransferase domain/Dimerisation domain